MSGLLSEAEDVSVIGGGWSVREVNLARVPGTVIAVNDAALLAPRVDAAVSMDRLWTEHRWKKLRGLEALAYIRRSALQNIAERPPWLVPFENDHTATLPSAEPGVLNGTNSGLCAVNLAYQLRPRRILLFGFDMSRGPKGESYWYPPYPWASPRGGTSDGRYREWAEQFEPTAQACRIAGIAVFNVSRGAIDAFPRIDPKEFA